MDTHTQNDELIEETVRISPRVPISVHVDQESYKFKMSKRLSWNYIISCGISYIEVGMAEKREMSDKIEKMVKIIEKQSMRLNELERPAKLKALGLDMLGGQ